MSAAFDSRYRNPQRITTLRGVYVNDIPASGDFRFAGRSWSLSVGVSDCFVARAEAEDDIRFGFEAALVCMSRAMPDRFAVARSSDYLYEPGYLNHLYPRSGV